MSPFVVVVVVVVVGRDREYSGSSIDISFTSCWDNCVVFSLLADVIYHQDLDHLKYFSMVTVL